MKESVHFVVPMETAGIFLKSPTPKVLFVKKLPLDKIVSFFSHFITKP